MELYRQVGIVPAQKTQVRLEFFVSLGRGVFNEFRREGCSRKHLTRGLPLRFKCLLQTICLESARTLLALEIMLAKQTPTLSWKEEAYPCVQVSPVS